MLNQNILDLELNFKTKLFYSSWGDVQNIITIK